MKIMSKKCSNEIVKKSKKKKTKGNKIDCFEFETFLNLYSVMVSKHLTPFKVQKVRAFVLQSLF